VDGVGRAVRTTPTNLGDDGNHDEHDFEYQGANDYNVDGRVEGRELATEKLTNIVLIEREGTMSNVTGFNVAKSVNA